MGTQYWGVEILAYRMNQMRKLRAEVADELTELRTTVDDLEQTVESAEQTLIENKLGAQDTEEVHKEETDTSVVSVESTGGTQPVNAD